MGYHTLNEIAKVNVCFLGELAQQFDELWILYLASGAEPRQVGNDEVQLGLVYDTKHTHFLEYLADLYRLQCVSV